MPLSNFGAPPADGQGAFLCMECIERQVDIEDRMPDLPPRYKQLLRDIMSCDSIAEAARRNDLSAGYVRALIKGRLPGPRQQEVAAAWQMLLEAEGLDLTTVARVGKALLHAVAPKWNPGTKKFDFFPDNSVRANMFRQLTRQHRVDPVSSSAFQGRGGTVIMIGTNLEVNSPEDVSALDADFVVETGRGSSPE